MAAKKGPTWLWIVAGLVLLRFTHGPSSSSDEPMPAVQTATAPALQAVPISQSQDSQATAPQRQLYVTASKLTLRASAGLEGDRIGRLTRGERVTAIEQAEDWTWIRTQQDGFGWASSRYLSETPPAGPSTAGPPKVEVRVPAIPIEALAKAIIAASIASYPGTCACPYNRDSRGHRCGRRSAHDRTGGYSVVCYPSEVTPEMVAEYREQR